VIRWMILFELNKPSIEGKRKDEKKQKLIRQLPGSRCLTLLTFDGEQKIE
jgi:hypothetical protein